MDLNIIKRLLDWPRGSRQYLEGVGGFLDFAFRNPICSESKIWCPCVKCVNRSKLSREEVYEHLVCNGMLRGYRQWTFHGEQIEQNTSSPRHSVEDDYSKHVDTHQLLPDVFGCGEDDSMPCPSDSMDTPTHNLNVEAENFYNLLKDADQELWPGCELTRLSFLVLLFYTKCTNKWSNKSFTNLLEILQLAIPNGKSLPKSFNEAKKIIKKLGLGYKNIHACPNNCQLYWKDKADDDTCSICGASRWKKFNDRTTLARKKKKKGTPAKVLRYFPLKPRLKRLYMSKHTSTLMRWHETDRMKDGALRHPADSEAWKSFDFNHLEFSSDSRNVRLGLATDGFNPFGKLSSSYSCWPVVLIPYNLPPWMCMKATSFILSLLIPGPSGPGNHIDIYLQPLIEELMELWEVGTDTYDSSCGETFRLKAALLWTINDFPAYGNLSGWNVHGAFACPCCNIDTFSKRLSHGRKYCFMGHRRFLEPNHKFRYNRDSFDGTEEYGHAPAIPTGTMILRQLEKITDFDDSQTWKKKSIFFTLPYWKSNLLRHNLDVMHIEKNVSENVYGTLLSIEGKSKDNLNARLDLQELNIREDLHPQQIGPNKLYLPSACYTMSRNEKQVFCNLLCNIKAPDGYTGNISRCVNSAHCKIFGLKSHDCHILMQQLLPIALRGLLPMNVTLPLFDLSSYFRELCSKVLHVHELDQLESRIRLTMHHNSEKSWRKNHFQVAHC
ncbi:uncharacterized protein LOC109706142, partial [Ananas comosus]|uniref:Uncharacterized protein LOC109706142 n=1 Tax=Ananas comosus TaxID=4615 RepID=A0A6P5EGF8_ANACO